MTAERCEVTRGAARITARVQGAGPPAVLVPSLGRAGSDFDDLAMRLAEDGFTAVAVDPRGLDGRGLDERLTLHDLAADVAAVIDALELGPVHLVGHALGNRISRCLTADRPEAVRSLTLLAAGGLVEPGPGVWEALAGCFVLDRPPEAHLRDVAFAFFADPAQTEAWRDGWFPAVAAAQRAAVAATDRDDWWGAAAPDVLVVQGLQDRIAVPENGRRYVRDLRVRAELVEIDGAGHGLLPERPAEIAGALCAFLRGVDARG